ncbi:hypothetical protein [Microbulbifer sp. THAF38]|uniref:hypothetical protein n=1 Tax=unclassified Microbulbifer TaxID=2619833 RepID=UPI0012692E7A|nr:hypothetical protein [Microbulbifer sp. THAF38]QFT56836.1 hypothetical protein FIU95_20020 [Microbulbifer sp. THAF38]
MNKASSEEQWSELETLWKQQRVSTKVPAAILKWVRRQERRMWMVVTFEWLFAIFVAVYAFNVFLVEGFPDSSLRIILILSMLVIAMVFSLLNRRGLWAPLEESTSAYINLALLRLRRKRREVHFSWIFVFFQLLIIGIWELLSVYTGTVDSLLRNPKAALIGFSVGMMVLAIYSYYIYWRTGREKASLEDLQKKYLN